jgi:hypothetical protein
MAQKRLKVQDMKLVTQKKNSIHFISLCMAMACLAGCVLAQQGEEALEGAQHGAVYHHGRRRRAALVCCDDAICMLAAW